MGNIIEFNNRSALKEEIDHLLKCEKEGRLENMIIIYSTKYKPGEEMEGYVGKLHHYWFGKSTIACLGLIHRMSAIVQDWIRTS